MSFGSPDNHGINASVEQVNADILAQNQANDTLFAPEAVHNIQFAEVGHRVLVAEQTASMENLVSLTADIDWEGSYSEEKRVRDKLAGLREELEILKPKMDERAQKIEADAEFVSNLVPASTPEVSSLKERLISKIVGEMRLEKEAEIASKEVELEQVGNQTTYAAWAIPRVANPLLNNTEETIELIEENLNFIEIDEFPVEDETRQKIAIECAKKKFNGMLPHASEMFAEILAGAAKSIFNQPQLAEALYGLNPTDPSGINSNGRISALVSNLLLNKVTIIAEVLSRHDLVFQKGRRTRHTPTGQQIGHELPIYRAIDPNDSEFQMTVVRRSGDGGQLRDGQWVTIHFNPLMKETTTQPLELEAFEEDVRKVVADLCHNELLEQTKTEIAADKLAPVIGKRTRNARNGLKKSGLISGDKYRVNSPLTACEAVLIKLYDNHKKVLDRNSRLKNEAVKLINNIISQITGEDVQETVDEAAA